MFAMDPKRKAIAIIPARGGSKRIPGKNIRFFCGKPLISYSITAALKSDLFSRVIVSTDDEEIARTARAFGAEIPFMRPPELSDDFTVTDDVIIHALSHLKSDLPEYACCIYATAPFITAEDLQRGLFLLIEHDAATAISATTFPACIHRALSVNQSGRLEMVWPENYLKRSQDFSAAWHDAGQFYWMNTRKYLKESKLFSSDAIPIPLPRKQVQDIDDAEDWETAELLYNLQQTGRWMKEEPADG